MMRREQSVLAVPLGFEYYSCKSCFCVASEASRVELRVVFDIEALLLYQTSIISFTAA